VTYIIQFTTEKWAALPKLALEFISTHKISEIHSKLVDGHPIAPSQDWPALIDILTTEGKPWPTVEPDAVVEHTQDVQNPLPDRIELMEPSRAYAVATPAAWHRFASWIRPATDVAVPFLGVSGCGKSTTINSFLGLTGSNAIPTGGGVNNSQYVYVVLYNSDVGNGRVFFIDFPGIGAFSRPEDRPLIFKTADEAINMVLSATSFSVVLVKECPSMGDPAHAVLQSMPRSKPVLLCANSTRPAANTKEYTDAISQLSEQVDVIKDPVIFCARPDVYSSRSLPGPEVVLDRIKQHIGAHREEIRIANKKSLERLRE
jgi:hypothetical protein